MARPQALGQWRGAGAPGGPRESRGAGARTGAGALAVIAMTAALAGALDAQESPLRAGPMLGYSQMREVAIWVQSRAPATVSVAYWPTDEPARRASTDAVDTDPARALIATLVARHLDPGRTYDYEVVVDGRIVPLDYPARFTTQTLWQWREDPPDFTIAIASCFYVNEERFDRPPPPYGGGFEILGQLYARRPDAMIWLGDNTYLREADWGSRSGILHRYSHTRAYPALQPLLASTHHYATWDDHDYGPNNSDRGFAGKAMTLEAFDLFWPGPPGAPGIDGVMTTFEWADALFVLLDNRFHRTPEPRVTGERTILGEEQLQWLVDTLVSSSAPFKFVVVGGQVLNPYDGFETYATYAAERERLLGLVRTEGIPGVIFLTGDRHRTELSRLDRSGTYPLYDVTVSPLTASPFTGAAEPNTLRVDGTLVQERNFALLEVAGPRTDRVLTIRVVDKDGTERWTRQLRARDLR